jgi:hypothetical protein
MEQIRSLVLPAQLVGAAHLEEEGAKQHRANDSRVSVYMRSVAAYKHIPLPCAMLANSTRLLPFEALSKARGSSERRLNHHSSEQ